MFERFTERARQVVVLAQEEARILKHDYIGSEHLLLGLLREEEGLAARLLRSLGLTAELVRAEVVGLVPGGEEASPSMLPFTPRAKKVLELTLREALALGHEEIATHHVLLGLLCEYNGTAAQVLLRLGVDVEELRGEVLAGIDSAPDEGAPSPRRDSGHKRPRRVRHNRGMFERFTERARQVVVLAQEEARILKHDYIGTEHILLGLLREEEGIAAHVLRSLNLTVERVRAQVVRLVGSGEEVTSGQIPFTPPAKKVLELALREALSLGHNYIGTEHILLGLVREDECVGARILLDLDVTTQRVRNEVIRMLSGPGGRPPTHRPAEPLEDFGHALLDGAGPAMRKLSEEIREKQGREADAGDLLALLALVPDGFAARTLAALEVAPDAFLAAVEEVRAGDVRSKLLPPPELEELRDRERKLREETRKTVDASRDELLDETRRRLGL